MPYLTRLGAWTTLYFYRANTNANDLYLPRAKLHLLFQASSSAAFHCYSHQALPATTCAVILLVQHPSGSTPFILELADRRLGYRSAEISSDIQWTSAIEARDALIRYYGNRNWPEKGRIGRIGCGKSLPGCGNCMSTIQSWRHIVFCGAYKGLSPFAYTLVYPITDTIRGLALEYILGSNMEQVKSGIDVSHEDAKTISSRCWTRSVVPRQRTTYCITTFTSATSQPGCPDKEWRDIVKGGADTRFMKRVLLDPKNGGWKKNVTPFEMSDYHYDQPVDLCGEYARGLPYGDDHLDAVTVSGFEITISVIPLASLTRRSLVIQNVLVLGAGLMIDDFSLDFHWSCRLHTFSGMVTATAWTRVDWTEKEKWTKSPNLKCLYGLLSKHAQPVAYPMAYDLPDHNAPAHAVFSERGLPILDIDGGD
ncbi:uncharacterized protein BT62DRAFT_1012562 [Guyanagaster necrorhizus]|uniref:Uncharacterized protein n=1 Tax=Guyanagaster necrorhizus TaxID=856835 RepID=A0A9P8ALV5_9AGAR|nr:uncharacterized protein BT62DRAFT_1012562 [Guyanagaster necrorhizus MCA 3950]KAG7440628.1 hypothetical protein BT62DRAFT_1012562 [Guyanagaster necrorhizus MCA 3950]